MLHSLKVDDRVRTCDELVGTIREIIDEVNIIVQADGEDGTMLYWFDEVEPYSDIQTVRDLIAVLQKCNPDAKPLIIVAGCDTSIETVKEIEGWVKLVGIE